ncbi:MAG: hypothetical protein IIC84_08895 [Chloroflexi bacterium]|nr:hypothetical protein [Chloroflexota bacterium]
MGSGHDLPQMRNREWRSLDCNDIGTFAESPSFQKALFPVELAKKTHEKDRREDG